MSTVSPPYFEGFRAAVGGGGDRTDPPAADLPGRGEHPPETVPPATLSREERIKSEWHPLDAFPRLVDCAKNDQPPREDDRFRFRWFGLFYQGPQQDAFVLRLRLPGGRLQAYQLAGLAALTQELAGGHVVCNAQGGLDIPGVPVRCAVEALRRVEELGLRSLLSGGDCVQAVRGGELEGLTDRSRPPTIYPLVRELEQALAMNRRLSDLPTACEVFLRESGEVPSKGVESDVTGGTVVFQATSVLPEDPAVPSFAGSGFSLSVSGFGPFDLTLTAAQVVPACLELLGRWAALGDRTDRRSAGIAAFCAGVGSRRLREWLTQLPAPPRTMIADARAVMVVESPPPNGVPVPGGYLLSGALERLAEAARCHGLKEVRLADTRLFAICPTDDPGAEEALREALSPS